LIARNRETRLALMPVMIAPPVVTGADDPAPAPVAGMTTPA